MVLHGLTTVEAMGLVENKGCVKSTGGLGPGGVQRQQDLVENSDLIEPDTELVAFTSWFEDLGCEARALYPNRCRTHHET